MNIKVKRPQWADVKLPNFGEMRVLDIGCGTAPRYVSSNYYSLDINKDFGPTIMGDAHNLPIKNDSVDVVLLLAVLEHAREPQRVLDETFNVLKEGGVMYVSVPFLYFRHDAMDYYRFTEGGIRHLLSKYTILEVERTFCGFLSLITSWLIPVSYAFPSPIARIFQSTIKALLNIFKVIDIGRNRFYSGISIKCEKRIDY